MDRLTSNKVIYLICAIVFFVANIDITVVNVVLPNIALTYSVSIIQLKNMLISFSIAYALAIPLVEFLVDRYSFKFIFLFACLGFAVSSFLCGNANSLFSLTVSRVIQGAFGGFFIPLARSAIVRASEHKNLALNLSNIQTVGMLGQALGPIIGSYFLLAFSWRYVFYFNLPFCATAGILMWVYLDKNFSWRQQKTERDFFDYFGYLFLAAVLISFLCIMDVLGSQDNLSDQGKVYLLCGIALFVTFTVLLCFHIKTFKKKQILDFNFIKENRKFRLYNLISILSRQYTSAIGFVLVLFFSVYRHVGHIQLSYLLLIYGAGIWASKLLMQWLLRKYIAEHIFDIVLKLLIAFNIIIFFAISYYDHYVLYFLASFFLGVLISLFHGYLNILTFVNVPKQKSVPASSFVSLITYLSYSSSIAIFSTVFYWLDAHLSSKYDVFYTVSVLSLFLLAVLILKRKLSVA